MKMKNVLSCLILFLVITATMFFVAGIAFSQTGTATITLTWPALPDNELPVSYNVYRATSSGAYTTVLGTSQHVSGATISYQDKAAAVGTVFYIVKGVNSLGQEGPASNEVIAKVPAPLTAPTVTISGGATAINLLVNNKLVASTTADKMPLNYNLSTPSGKGQNYPLSITLTPNK